MKCVNCGKPTPTIGPMKGSEVCSTKCKRKVGEGE